MIIRILPPREMIFDSERLVPEANKIVCPGPGCSHCQMRRVPVDHIAQVALEKFAHVIAER